MRSLIAGALCALALVAALIPGAPAFAHEGHDHATPPAAPGTGFGARGEAASALYEIVAIAKGEELLIFLDRFATNNPVEGATLEAETPSGPLKASAEAGAPYRLTAPFVAKPGRYDVIFTVTEGANADVLPLTLTVPSPTAPSAAAPGGLAAGLPFAAAGLMAGLLLGAAFLRRRRPTPLAALAFLLFLAPPSSAHEGHDHGEAPTAAQPTDERAQRLSDGSVFAPKPVQRIFAVRTIVSEAARHMRSIELPGRIIPDPNASGFVQSAVGGRLSAPEGGFPRLGTPVNKGDILAFVTPPLQAIDVSDMRQRMGELDQQIAIVERRLTRLEPLLPSGAVTRAAVEEARLELQGLRDRRGALERSRAQPEALVAPVSGVIAEGSPVAGQIVASSAVVFHIVDPSRLWVEALSFEAIAPPQGASASTASGKSVSLIFRGSGFADRSQSIPVHFAIEGDTAGLRAGQFVTVLVTTGEVTEGIALPRGSLVRSANGQDFIYEHVTAERFMARAVRTEPLDAARVLVGAGIAPGVRIVTQGAELLDHVR